MLGKKHTAANGLSWRDVIPAKMKKEKNINDFIDIQLNFLRVFFSSHCASFFFSITTYMRAFIIMFLPC